MRLRTVSAVAVVGLLLAGCGAPADEAGGSLSAPDETSSTVTVADVDYGPFLADDPFDVVASMSWLGVRPALPHPIRDDGPIAVLMDDSTPDVLHVAVNGGGCEPRVTVDVVQGPPALELGIAVGEGIAPPGIQCTDLLTTHAFEVRLTQQVALDDVVLKPLLSNGERQAVVAIPGDAGTLAADTIVSCPGGPTFPFAALANIPPVESIDAPDLVAAMEDFLGDREGQSWPQDGWRVLEVTDESALIVNHDDDTGDISFMSFDRTDGSWRWVGASSGGPCPLQIALPEGLGVVTWRLDPAADPLTPQSTSIRVLVTERDCAGGRPMGDRLVGPEVLMTSTSVLIAFAARAQAGAQDCQSNPETPVVVELPEPLGDRIPRDALDTGFDLADFLR